MKKKNVLVAGILGLLLVLGAAVALAQNTGEKTKDAENHECTQQMMENMPENCPMQSGGETDHCTGMGSGMGSMMGSGGADKRGMM